MGLGEFIAFAAFIFIGAAAIDLFHKRVRKTVRDELESGRE